MGLRGRRGVWKEGKKERPREDENDRQREGEGRKENSEGNKEDKENSIGQRGASGKVRQRERLGKRRGKKGEHGREEDGKMASAT